MLDLDNMFRDPEEGSELGKIELMLPSDGLQLNAILLNAAGEGPKPLVVLLHGFPGNERNLDLAESLRAAGCHVLFFHYKGAWGSPGSFTFTDVLRDAGHAVEFFRDRERAARYGVDPDRIFITGHSMGGFAAITTLALRDDVVGAVAMAPYDFAAARAKSEEGGVWLENYNAVVRCPLPPLTLDYENILHDELSRHTGDWLLPSRAAGLAGKRLAIFAFDRDVVSLPELHLAPLEAAFTPVMGEGLTIKHFDCDHGYNSKRYAVARATAEWIGGLCGEPASK